MGEYALGIDLGGTNVKGLAVMADGRVMHQAQLPTGDTGDESWMENVRRLIRQVTDHFGAKPGWMGLAAPGLAAKDQRSIAVMPGRLRGIEGLVWQQFLESERPVPVLNDANAALIGECWLGAARGARNAAMVTLGTGVGGAVICDGRLLQGHLGRAGHLGHMSLNPEGPQDVTGMPGSLEVVMGECTVNERSGGRFVSTRELVAAHLRGDAAATETWLRSVRGLAAALASFVNLFDPEVLVVGGGIAQAGKALFEPLEQYVRQFEWQATGFRVPIKAAQLSELAGAYGAAHFAMTTNTDH